LRRALALLVPAASCPCRFGSGHGHNNGAIWVAGLYLSFVLNLHSEKDGRPAARIA